MDSSAYSLGENEGMAPNFWLTIFSKLTYTWLVGYGKSFMCPVCGYTELLCGFDFDPLLIEYDANSVDSQSHSVFEQISQCDHVGLEIDSFSSGQSGSTFSISDRPITNTCIWCNDCAHTRGHADSLSSLPMRFTEGPEDFLPDRHLFLSTPPRMCRRKTGEERKGTASNNVPR